MSHFDGMTEEPVEVLSMYDGMSCGHIALDKLGVDITAYYATEIDKYAVQNSARRRAGAAADTAARKRTYLRDLPALL